MAVSEASLANLKRGNPGGGGGRPPGAKNPASILADFRYVYQKQEAEDKTEGHRVLRTYLREKPTEFVRQMIQMELQHAARKMKNQTRLAEAATPEAEVIVPEEEDDGVERAKGMLDRSLEEFDAQSGQAS